MNIDAAFKGDGGLGGMLGQPVYDKDSGVHGSNISYYRILFDNVFNFIVLILVVELLAGIIIDTFATLREQSHDREDDSTSRCFICGQSKETLDKQPGFRNFKYHISVEHNMWNYVFFIDFLQ